MSSAKLTVMYGHLEGAGRDFARDPTGYLSIEAGIFAKHGLEVSWQHVQGTEERYRKLEEGSAHISLLVGRASLQHFLTAKTTCIIGCVMNSCPYYLVAAPGIATLKDLRGKVVVCREGPSRGAPIAETFHDRAGLRIGTDLTLQLLNGDQDAFDRLVSGEAQAALLPRPFGFIAEARGFTRIVEWPEVVDDPLPITIETTKKMMTERDKDLRAFLAAHREGIALFKSNPADAKRILQKQFGHAPALAEQIFTEYVSCMDASLKVDFRHFAKLYSQVAPNGTTGAREIAAQWIAFGALQSD